jgi:parallel beta-helix repeat protein
MNRFWSKIGVMGFLLWGVVAGVHADFTTPGTGVYWTLDSLVFHSNGAVTGSGHTFYFHQSILVSASDTLNLLPGDSLLFVDTSGNLKLEIHGTLLAVGTPGDSIYFTSQNQSYGDYAGIEFRSSATTSRMEFCRVEFAERAVRAIDAHPEIRHSLFRDNGDAAIDLTGSQALIEFNRFIHNRRYTVKMTLSSSPTIRGNYFAENNFENQSPYVIITVGLQGVNSPIIEENTILGGYSKSGGIAIWGNSQAVIRNNHIENCAYGILCYQAGANPLIDHNTLLNNNINPDTVYFGFGIACNGSNHPIIKRNTIQGHFYGVAIVNNAQPVLGNLSNADTTDDGGNRFLGNGIGSRKYELYNNNPLPIMAEGNWWGTDNPDSIEARIVHQPDNPAYGLVDYQPFLTGDPLSLPRVSASLPATLQLSPAYPNPFNARVTFAFRLTQAQPLTIRIFDVHGRLIRTLLHRRLPAGFHQLQWDARDEQNREMGSGVYFVHFLFPRGKKVQKIIFLK